MPPSNSGELNVPGATPPSGRTWWILLPILGVYALFVWRFDFLCDDAFITFRFAKHLAQGEGLRYNLGVDPPVEGYSNLLWVLWNAILIRLGLTPELFSRVTSIALGAHLLFLVVARVRREAGGALPALAAGLFLAGLAPFAVWSTGGLATIPFAWALFALFDRLARERPSLGPAAGFGAMACLLRADGPLWVGLALAGAVASRGGSREVRRAAIRAGAVVAAVVAAQIVFRLAVHGQWAPQTALVKVAPGWLTFEQGAKYVATQLLTYPSLLVAGFLPVFTISRERWLGLLGPVLGGLLYATFVGGDFMACARFLVPTLPFLAVGLGLGLGALPLRPVIRISIVALTLALSLPGAYGRPLFSEGIQERLHFRWNSARAVTEYDFWRSMKRNSREWSLLGIGLRRFTEPGDSIVLGAIGAVGYYSDLFVYDKNGLVTRSVTDAKLERQRRSPGHWRTVDPEFFLGERPTVLKARLLGDEGSSELLPPPGPEAREHYELVNVVLPGTPELPVGLGLSMWKRKSVPGVAE